MNDQPLSESAITVTALGPQIGAEVSGVDASQPLSADAHRAVRDALHRYGVIVLRGQQALTPAGQVRFARLLGKPRVSFFNEFAVEGAPELTTVSNIRRDGKPIGLVDAGALWHTDGSYLERPDLYTVLHAIEVPQRDGVNLGDTLFLSTADAYDALDDALRRQADSARAIHSLAHNAEMKRKARLNAPPVDQGREAVHPVVRRHPVTGRRCLFVSEGHTKAIVGLPTDASDALLAALVGHLQQDRFKYRHRWQVGDLLVWDNCTVQHLAITDYGTLPRRLHRSGIEGPIPVA